MTDIDVADLVRQQHRKHQNALTEQVIGVGRKREQDEREVTEEYELSTPLAIDQTGHGDLTHEITRVRVSVTTRPNSDWSDPENAPYYRASGYAYALTAKGKRDKRATGYWISLPEEIAVRALRNQV